MKFIFQYEVGDRVICIDTIGVSGVSKGETGVVVDIRPGKCGIGVCWDKEVRFRHACDGTCKKGHGWYVRPELIALNQKIF